jgi:hypothetical protein
MLGEVRTRWRALRVRVLSLSLFGSVAAHAVSQPPPDSTPLPQPVPAAETTVIVSRSFPESAVTLAGLFQFRSESIDPSADAVADPGTFRPLCDSPDSDVTAEFVLHGGGCTLALGWYNAIGGAAPAAAEIFTMIPSSVTTEMGCTIADFCPLAAPPTTIFTWSPIVHGGNICNDPRYLGGDIGFAVLGNSTQPCTATKYSERAANVVCTVCEPNTPWITALVYRSSLRSDAYYLAFEDLPMSPTDWQAPTTSAFAPDGDFNDFVFHLTGVCHGGDECMAGGGTGTGGTSNGGSDNGGSSNGGSSNGGSDNGGSGNGGSDNGGSSNGGSSNGGNGETGGNDKGGSDNGGGAGLGEGGDGTSGTSPGTCVPGREVACTCSNGSEGSQRCLDDGRGFEACTCGDGDEDDNDASGGCGCRHSAPGETGFWTFAAMTLVALRRRFRRRSRPTV